MKVHPNLDRLGRGHGELRKRILRVHHVVEREFGVQAHRRHDLEESAVSAVLGVGVA